MSMLETDPFIIAEMACAHHGEVQRAYALIDAAVAAGVDAVQIQIFRRTHQVGPGHYLYPLLGDLEFSASAWESIVDHARHYKVALYAFVYDVPSLELALMLDVDGLKLSSSDLSNPALLERAALTGLPVYLGTGASTVEEISAAIHLMEDQGSGPLTLMHGVQNFPTAPEDAHIFRIQLLKDAFRFPVGYQDHTDAATSFSKSIDLIALGAGATVFEKHITLDRQEKGTDYQAALEPDEMMAYVSTLRLASRALGPRGWKPFSESDYTYRKFQKKKIVASKQIPEGTILEPAHITLLRHDGDEGLSPWEVESVIGKRVIRDIDAFQPVRKVDIRSEVLV